MTVTHRDDADSATRAQWDAFCHETALAMQDHCMRYITPVSESVEQEWGALEGSGGYIGLGGKRLLLTNEHVIRDFANRQFCHQFHDCEDVLKLDKPIALEKHPVDTAICVIRDDVWAMRPHAAEAVPPERIAERHQPLPGELLFFAGYPEKRFKSLHKAAHQPRDTAPDPGAPGYTGPGSPPELLFSALFAGKDRMRRSRKFRYSHRPAWAERLFGLEHAARPMPRREEGMEPGSCASDGVAVPLGLLYFHGHSGSNRGHS